MRHRLWSWSCLVLGLALSLVAVHAALVDRPLLAEATDGTALPLVRAGQATALHVAGDDWPGVLRAAGDLQADIERVSGRKPALLQSVPSPTPVVVLIGTVGKSALIDGLVAAGKLDVAAIRGRWESFIIETVESPLPGVDRALVIAGSDKRGTIYGIYEISEQIGVSPWYWWADVPVQPRATLAIKSGRTVVDSPVVQYRGIFLNDEAPALTGWVYEKFGNFDHTFYGKLFELLLRLRANYLWPAMWQPRAFNDDDPENGRLADEYGIVMGTSHHEPMMRAHDEWGRYGKGPWNYAKNAAVLHDFWRAGFDRSKNYETITTLGMRGDGDEAMSEETNVSLLEHIVADQRQIIADVTGRPPEQTPQLWALYKEVQGYYERGMRVPDDVILLWCDDNWGNIRRLPTPAERQRRGGAGVYYHFDYVGGPRNYKWMNVTPITKVWEQMHLAWQLEANRIWIVNVGDLKPMEFPIEFFLSYAWNPARWPYGKLEEYSRQWAEREFGAAQASEIAALISGYTKLNRQRTPEMLSPDTYSLVNYREAERILAQWRDLVTRAEAVEAALPEAARAAFYQLVLHPVKASATVREVHVAAGQNALYAEQGRALSANLAADHARAMFAQDAALQARYHALLGGKWNHMMSEKKFGYTYWQTPAAEVMPALSLARPMQGPEVGLAVEGSRFAYPRWGLPAPRTPAIDVYARDSTWVDLFSRGDTALDYQVKTAVPWLRVTPATGTLTDNVRLTIEADWEQVPLDAAPASFVIEVSTRAELNPLDPATAKFSAPTRFGQSYTVTVPVLNPSELRPGTFDGHIETNEYVSIEAQHFTRAVTAAGIEWRTLSDHGRTLGGVTVFPVTAATVAPGGSSPRLEYDFFLFSTKELKLDLHFAPSLDFQSGDGLRFAVSIDDGEPQVLKLDTWKTLQTWEQAVGDGVRHVMTTQPALAKGRHTLKFWMVTPGVVLQKIVIDAGGVKPSYLGPPESPRGK